MANNRVYHEETPYSDYSKPPPRPPPQKKGGGGQRGMKKGQGGRSGSPSSNKYYNQTNAKTLNPLSKRF